MVVLGQSSVVTEVSIKGNKRTKTSFLKKLAFVKEGSVLDSARLAADERRFRLLPSVASASYEVIPLEENKYKIVYTVVENFAIIPGLNVTQDVNDDIAFRTSLFDFNFLGQNQIIGGFLQSKCIRFLWIFLGSSQPVYSEIGHWIELPK